MKQILKPILDNITLFIISILLLGGFDVFYHQYNFHENDTMGMLSAYGEMILEAYLICLCSYWLRKIHLKVAFYIILFTIYAVNCYLRYAYSTDISPKILLLLFETNNKEITGFFKTYFMTPAMYKTIAIVSFMLLLTVIGELYREKITRLIRRPITIIMWSSFP